MDEESLDLLTEYIHEVWWEYTEVFGIPPYGTLVQIRACLELKSKLREETFRKIMERTHPRLP
jgi:hypothetical protein